MSADRRPGVPCEHCGAALVYVSGVMVGGVVCPDCDAVHVAEVRTLARVLRVFNRTDDPHLVLPVVGPIGWDSSARPYVVGHREGDLLTVDGWHANQIEEVAPRGRQLARDLLAVCDEMGDFGGAPVQKMREKAARLLEDLSRVPPVSLLERLRAEQEDGYYLYPRAP